MATGGTFQEKVAETIAPLLRDGQIILLVQGNTGGALVVRRALDRAGSKAWKASGAFRRPIFDNLSAPSRRKKPL